MKRITRGLLAAAIAAALISMQGCATVGAAGGAGAGHAIFGAKSAAVKAVATVAGGYGGYKAGEELEKK